MRLNLDTISASSSTGSSPPAASRGQPARLQEAASQFEGLLVAQMLRHARQAGDGGWMGAGEDKSSESMMEMAEESLARMMAAQGCLGLASLMTQGVAREAAVKSSPPEQSPLRPMSSPALNRETGGS